MKVTVGNKLYRQQNNKKRCCHSGVSESFRIVCAVMKVVSIKRVLLVTDKSCSLPLTTGLEFLINAVSLLLCQSEGCSGYNVVK